MRYLVIHYASRYSLSHVADVFRHYESATRHAQQLVNHRGGFSEIRFD